MRGAERRSLRSWPGREIPDGYSTFGAPLTAADEFGLSDQLVAATAAAEALVGLPTMEQTVMQVQADIDIALASRRWIQNDDGHLVVSDDARDHSPWDLRSGTLGVLRYWRDLQNGVPPDELLFRYQLMGVLLCPNVDGPPSRRLSPGCCGGSIRTRARPPEASSRVMASVEPRRRAPRSPWSKATSSAAFSDPSPSLWLRSWRGGHGPDPSRSIFPKARPARRSASGRAHRRSRKPRNEARSAGYGCSRPALGTPRCATRRRRRSHRAHALPERSLASGPSGSQGRLGLPTPTHQPRHRQRRPGSNRGPHHGLPTATTRKGLTAGIALCAGERSYTYDDRIHVMPIDRLWA